MTIRVVCTTSHTHVTDVVASAEFQGVKNDTTIYTTHPLVAAEQAGSYHGLAYVVGATSLPSREHQVVHEYG